MVASTIRSLLGISGLYDLNPLRQVAVNDDLRMDPSEAQALSPLYMAPAAATRLGFAYGALETPPFRAQTQAIARNWNAAAPVELPGCHHYATMDALATEGGELFGLALDLAEAEH